MEVDMTINEVLCFLSEMDLSDKLDNNQLEKIKQIKKTNIKEFEDTNLSRTSHTLNISDGEEMSYVTNIEEIDYRAERNQSIRSNIFHLVSLKQIVDTKNKKMNNNVSPPQENNNDFFQINE